MSPVSVCARLDDLLGPSWGRRRCQLVVHVAGHRVHVEPARGVLADADLAVCGVGVGNTSPTLMAPEAVFAVSAPCARSTTMSPLAEFTREVAGGLADSGYPPEFIDGPGSADRADAELAAAGGDVDRATPMSGPVRGWSSDDDAGAGADQAV
jgi:hypothetical protein